MVIAGLSLPLYAQQAGVDHLQTTAASLTAESAKGGENALYQVCGANSVYGLCVTFPSADASEFAEGMYTNVNFAKDMARQGFAQVLVRNTTTDKTLAQSYAMNVTAQGWAANDKRIHDPAEYTAVMLAENQHSPAKKAIAIKSFLEQYPDSVVREAELDRLLIAQTQSGDQKGSVATAKQLLATTSPTDPERIRALKHLVSIAVSEAKAGTNTEQNLRDAREYSGMGKQALEQASKPAYFTEEQFGNYKSSAASLFDSVLAADAASRNIQPAVADRTNVPPPTSYSETMRGRINTDLVLVTFTASFKSACDNPALDCGKSIFVAFLRPCASPETCKGNGPFFDLPEDQHAHEVAAMCTYPDIDGCNFMFVQAGRLFRTTILSDNSIRLIESPWNMISLSLAPPEIAQNLALAENKQRKVQEEAQREVQKKQEAFFEENMPQGKASVKFTLQLGGSYNVILQSVNGGKKFVAGCDDANSTCRHLKREQTYRITRLAQNSPDAYTGDGVLGTVAVSDPSREGEKILYAVLVGSNAQPVWDGQEEEQDKVFRAVLRKRLKALGFHRGQSQAEVKLILQLNGFATWRCDSDRTQTDCIAQRPKGSAGGQAEVSVIFINEVHQHRDPDTGTVYTDKVDRMLASVGYSEGTEALESLGPDPF